MEHRLLRFVESHRLDNRVVHFFVRDGAAGVAHGEKSRPMEIAVHRKLSQVWHVRRIDRMGT